MPTYVANGRRAWGIAGLLFLFTMVNFLDKLVMGLAGVPIMREFHLSPSAYGALSSSFFVLYAISGLLVGLFAVQRASPKWLLVVLVVIWTVSQLPMAFGSTLAALYLGRILLGIGEGPATPSAYHTLYGWFTSDRRNLPTSFLLAGIGVGFLVGSPLLTQAITSWGWRSGFMLCGVVGALWLVLWMVFGADGPLIERTGSPVSTEARVPWGQFWADPAVAANLVVASASYWMTGLSLAWLAPYLQLGLGYSARDTGWLVSVILGSQVIVQVSISFLSHRMLMAGISSRFSRGFVNGASVLGGGCAMLAATMVEQPAPKVLLLILSFCLPQVSFAIGPAIVGEIAPAPQRGVALLVTYSVCTVTGLLSPLVIGWAVEAAGSEVLAGYNHALWLTAALLAFGGVYGMIWINPEAARARFASRARNPLLIRAAAL